MLGRAHSGGWSSHELGSPVGSAINWGNGGYGKTRTRLFLPFFPQLSERARNHRHRISQSIELAHTELVGFWWELFDEHVSSGWLY